jgi:hypothetical protein
MRMGRMGMLAAAVAFARSERGQKFIAGARRKYDTPANRAKLTGAIGDLRNRPTGTAARRAR